MYAAMPCYMDVFLRNKCELLDPEAFPREPPKVQELKFGKLTCFEQSAPSTVILEKNVKGVLIPFMLLTDCLDSFTQSGAWPLLPTLSLKVEIFHWLKCSFFLGRSLLLLLWE